jgi:hypothetical protein
MTARRECEARFRTGRAESQRNALRARIVAALAQANTQSKKGPTTCGQSTLPSQPMMSLRSDYGVATLAESTTGTLLLPRV